MCFDCNTPFWVFCCRQMRNHRGSLIPLNSSLPSNTKHKWGVLNMDFWSFLYIHWFHAKFLTMSYDDNCFFSHRPYALEVAKIFQHGKRKLFKKISWMEFSKHHYADVRRMGSRHHSCVFRRLPLLRQKKMTVVGHISWFKLDCLKGGNLQQRVTLVQSHLMMFSPNQLHKQT